MIAKHYFLKEEKVLYGNNFLNKLKDIKVKYLLYFKSK